jgi:hypothetical protein
MDVQRQRVSLWVASLAGGLTASSLSFGFADLWPVAAASWAITLFAASTVAVGGTSWRRAFALVLVMACALGLLAAVALFLYYLREIYFPGGSAAPAQDGMWRWFAIASTHHG